MDNLVVVVRSLGSVGEKLAELSQKSLPVAGNIFHSQVVDDEFLPPVERGTKRKKKSQTPGFLLKFNHKIWSITLWRSPVQRHHSLWQTVKVPWGHRDRGMLTVTVHTKEIHSPEFYVQAIQVLTCNLHLIYGHRCVKANMEPLRFLLLTVHSQDSLWKYRTETIN